MRRMAGSSFKCGNGVQSPRAITRLLAVLLLAAAPHGAAAQWTLTADVGAPRFSGGSHEVGGNRSLRPYRPTLIGVGVERTVGSLVMAVHGYRASTSLALEGGDAVVAVKDALTLYGVGVEVSVPLADFGTGARLMMYGAPLIEKWGLADEASHVRAGLAASVGLQVALGAHWSAVVRGGATVSGSPFAPEDLAGGYEPRTLWRREVSGRLRYRL